jgi:dienelactone hydrolase
VAAAIDTLDGLDDRLDLANVQVVGHSAGGRLAKYLAGRGDGKVRLKGAVSISGVLDLVEADKDRLGSEFADPNAEEPAGVPPVEFPDANHFDVINPAHESWRAVRDWLADRLA